MTNNLTDLRPFTVTFAFDSAEVRHHFLVWFLDGGGEDQYGEFCDHRPSETPAAYFKDWPTGIPKELVDIRIEAPSMLPEDTSG